MDTTHAVSSRCASLHLPLRLQLLKSRTFRILILGLVLFSSATVANAALPAPGVTKAFSPTSVSVGGTSQLTIKLTNPNGGAITDVQFTDSYPGGMKNAPTGVIVAENTCNANVAAPPNATSIGVTNGTIPANDSCSIVVNVVGTSAGSFINHTGVVTSTNADPGADASATLSVINTPLVLAPLVTKSFAPSSAPVGGTSQMTIKVSNPNPVPIAGAQLQDFYPFGIGNTASDIFVRNTCGGTLVVAPFATTLAGATIPSNFSCDIVVNVTGTAQGVFANNTGPVASGNAQSGPNATASLTATSGALIGAPSADVVFSPSSVQIGDPSLMTIKLTNFNGTAITSTQFNDFYPAGIANAPTGAIVSNGCGGSVTANASGTSGALANGTIPANGDCSVVLKVVGAAAGVWNNQTGAILSGTAQSGPSASRNLTVTPLAAPGVSMEFEPASIVPGGTAQLVIVLTNNNANSAITGIQFFDSYPGGFANAASGVVVNNSCGGTLSASPNASSISLSNGVVLPNLSCTIVINVKGTNVGSWVNHTGVVTSANAVSAPDTSATLTVLNGSLMSAPTVTKEFAPASVSVGGMSQMTIKLTNPNGSAITGAQFADIFPAGMYEADSGVLVSNSCGGNVYTYGDYATLNSGTVPANGSCSVVVKVVGTSPGSWVNQTGAVASSNAFTGNSASATLTVTNAPLLPPPGVSKAFAPGTIPLGGTAQMTIALSNSNASAISGAQFLDIYPVGMANALSGIVSNTCGGTLIAVPNDTQVSLANGTIPANSGCSVVVNIVGASSGTLTNWTGQLFSGNAQSANTTSGVLTVTNTPVLPAPTVIKSFFPASVPIGGITKMSITLSNSDLNNAITGVQLTDNYPTPLHMANAPFGVVVGNSCGGTLTAAPNGTSVALVNGSIPANSNCSVEINVVGTSTGTSINHTGIVQSTNASTGSDVTAALTVTNTPMLSPPTATKEFAPASVLVGGTSQMTIKLTNPNSSAITGAVFTDTYPAGIANAANGVVVNNSCGAVTALANGSSVSLSNGVIPPNGSCSVVINVVGTVPAIAVNHTGAVLSTNANSGADASASLAVMSGPLMTAPSATKTFTPGTVSAGGTSQMTITLNNPNFSAIAGAQFTDIYPVGLFNAPSGVVVSNTCGGTVTAPASDFYAILSNGTIPALGTCSVVIDVVGASSGMWNNQTGAIVSGNAQNGASANGTLTVTNVPLLTAPTVTKAFAPSSVPVASTSKMTITLSNPNASAITSAQFTDNYPTPLHMANAPTGVVDSNTCGGTLTASTNATFVALANGTIPANGSCSVVINVVGTSPGSSLNHTGAVPSANANAGGDATATLIVTNVAPLASPTVAKAFAPASVSLGGSSQMTITLTNGNGNAITGVQFTDNYPASILNAGSGVVESNTCGGTVTAAANGISASLTNGAIPANQSCAVKINVVGTSIGNLINHTGAVTSANANAGADASATLTVSGSLLNAPLVSKVFSPASVTVGGTSQMIVTLINPNNFTPITGAQFADIYPAGIANAPSGVVVSNTCGGTLTAAPNGTSATLANGTIPPNQGCIVRINTVGTSVGSSINHTGTVTSDNASAGLDASAILNVTQGSLLPAPTTTKVFAPANITVGGSSQMTITLDNPSATAIVGAQFTDFYPAGMTESGYGVLSNTCGGFIDEYPDSVALANGTIPAQGSCSVVVQMTGTVGTLVNQTSSVPSANAATGNAASATLTVVPGSLLTAPTVAKAFAPTSVGVGGTSQMTITLTNNDPNNAVTGAQIFDSYPGPQHMANAPSNVVASNTCGGSISAAPNGTSAVLTNGTIPANGSCRFVLNVVGTSQGLVVNHTGTVLSGNANVGADSSATLTVTGGALMNAPTVAKAFAPSSVALGIPSQMTITLSNPNGTAITGAQFTDLYPVGMANAASGVLASNTCGGTVTAPANGTSTALANGTIPATGNCTVAINVIGTSTGSFVNHTGFVTSANANASADASATLTVPNGALNAPTVAKAFAPASVPVGDGSQMTITLTNTNGSDITGAQFTDVYPGGMTNAVIGAVESNTCGGTVTATANGTSASLANGTIPANQSCAVKINVVGWLSGASVNHTGAVTSANANAGTDAIATLTVTNGGLLSAPTAMKAFAPASVSVGGTSQMTITLANFNSSSITGAQFSDNYPAGMANAGSGVVVSNTCVGSVTAAANGTSVALADGIVPANSLCSVVVNVVGTSPGNSVNQTGPIASENAQTGAGASATLTVTNSALLSAPTATKAFAPASVTLGGTSQMTIMLSNPNSNAITSAQFMDAYPAGMMNLQNGPIVVDNTCGGTLVADANTLALNLTGGTIPANDSCSVVINVVGTLVGTSNNQTGAIASGNAQSGTSANAILTVTSGPLLSPPTVTKVFTPASVPVGGSSQMTITLTNPNVGAITGAQFTDLYPAGMVNANNNVIESNTCAGALSALADGTSTALANAVIAASDSCRVVINVVGTTVGSAVNHTGSVQSANANVGADALATLTVTSSGNSQPPVAVGDAIEVALNGSADMLVGDPIAPSSVLDNDVDPDIGDTLTANKLSDPTHGSVLLNSNGTFSYQNDGSGTTDSFSYEACDSSNACSAETTVTITIGTGLSNHVPFAVDDAFQVAAGGTADTLVGDPSGPSSVLDNDIDPDADTLTASKLTDPGHGNLTFNADGTFSYHNTDSATSDSFLYQACDTRGACDLGLVTITIDSNPSNHLPIVVDDAIQATPNGSADFLIGDPNAVDSVLDNDSDPDAGDVLTAVKIGGLLNASGSVTFNSDGTFMYQHTNPSVATDTFLYEACDQEGACTPGIVSITISSDPMDLLPIAMDDAIEVAPNGTADNLVGDPNVVDSVLDNDTDPDIGDTLMAHLISAPSNGDITFNTDGTFTYTNTNPIADEFQYEACDTHGACVAATVSITINPGAPTVSCILPRQVDVVGDTVSQDLSLLFTPPPGQTLTYSATNLPPSLSIMGSLLSGTLQASDLPGSPYASTLRATTVPGNVSASENVIFQVLPTGEIVLRNGFDGSNPSQPCN